MIKSRYLDIVEYAYNNVPLYMRRDVRYEDIMEWEDIPILTKDEIQKNSESLYSCEYMSTKRKNKVMQSRTSGSTGKCLKFHWDKDDMSRSLLYVWVHRKKYYNITPKDKMCYFYTSPNVEITGNDEQYSEVIGSALGFSKLNLDGKRLEEIYDKILEYNPAWLFIQPSMATILCNVAEKRGKIPAELRYIELTGEMLSFNLKKRIKKVFRCNVANHYGANEVNTIAYECPYGNMHIADGIKIEVLNEEDNVIDNKKQGKLIVTSIHNRVSPFVRYDIGDMGIIRTNVECQCGCNSECVELTSGRTYDNIVTENGAVINAYIFVHAVESINKIYYGAIKQFKIKQCSYKKFKVILVIDDEVYELGIDNEMIEESFKNSVKHEELKDVSYEFEYSDYLIENGKMLWFEKELNLYY